jgi:hypothetical protein
VNCKLVCPEEVTDLSEFRVCKIEEILKIVTTAEKSSVVSKKEGEEVGTQGKVINVDKE